MSSRAFVIETERHTAGIAVAEGRDFVFYAADRLFTPLEGRRFPSVTQAQRAVRAREDQDGGTVGSG